MPQTVEVRFKGTRRDFYLWPDDQEPLHLREAVVVAADRGSDLGRVHTAGLAAEKKCGSACTACAVGEGVQEAREGGQVVAEEASSPAESAAAEPAPETAREPQAVERRPVLRRATTEDVRQANELRRSEEDARRQIAEKVRQHKLEMKISDTEWQWDRTKLTVFFTAEKRVDFRALVRDLATIFRTRIELRQIGVRDEAARLTGVGRCGREYCCSTWLKELSPVSLALAKDQHLSLNPSQISGGCGRLLCCLKYEHEFYVAARKRFPREGKMLEAARGPEKVIAVDIFRERVFLRNEEGSRIIPLVQLREEMEQAAVLGVAARAPDGSQAARPERRPPPSERPRSERPPRSEPGPRTPLRDQAPPPSSPRPAPPRPGRQDQRPPRDRQRHNPEPPPAPPATTPASEAEAPSPAGGPSKRRRRRGRRGGRGGGPSAPPSAPEG